MSTKTEHVEEIEVNGLRVDVVRKAIRNLHLVVYPPGGTSARGCATAPGR